VNRYRNVELSDPRYETGGLRHLTFRSEALGRRGDVTIFVPPGCESARRLPLVVLLHGVYGSHWTWAMRGGAHATALALIEGGRMAPSVILMPSDGMWGDGAGYLPHPDADYERWVMDDVVGCCSEVVACVDGRSPLFLAGQSMGGYGALRLGAKYAERVAAFSAHSSVTDPRQLARYVSEPLELYGEAALGEDALPLRWMELRRDRLPPFRFDCGREDALIESNRELHRSLDGLGVGHVYEEFEGGHDWDYWREHVADTLLFFDSCLSGASL
jgi:enterochelin esterase-like enzyme